MSRLGAVCSERVVYELNGVLNYLHVGWWLPAHGFSSATRTQSRSELFELIASEISEREVLYLEFGVHEGNSMRLWAELLENPRSHLHGFDSFLGLPHDWSLEGHERGYFSTDGVVPRIDDPRVRFYSGWFEDTLPDYEWPEHEVLVVMLEADLYSSTATVLNFVADRFVPSSYLYFDQFHHRADELRAFAEFYDEHDMSFSSTRHNPRLQQRPLSADGMISSGKTAAGITRQLRQRCRPQYGGDMGRLAVTPRKRID